MSKGEISWSRLTEEGAKRRVYAARTGDRWLFYEREKRYDVWQPIRKPRLDDWLELLDGVKRRIQRRLVRPEEAARLKKTILELYPDARFTE